MKANNRSVKTTPKKKKVYQILVELNFSEFFCLEVITTYTMTNAQENTASLHTRPKTRSQQNKAGFCLLVLTSRKSTLIAVNDTMEWDAHNSHKYKILTTDSTLYQMHKRNVFHSLQNILSHSLLSSMIKI